MRKGFRRSLAMLLLGAAPGALSGCAACQAVGRATAVTARTTYNVTKMAVVGTAKATKKGLQTISRDPQSAPGGLDAPQVAYNPFDPDAEGTATPLDREPSRRAEAPRSRDADALVVADDAPMRGSQGVRYNLPSLDIETMIAEAKPSRSASRTR